MNISIAFASCSTPLLLFADLVFCAGGPVAAARVLVLFAGALRAAVDSTIILDCAFAPLEVPGLGRVIQPGGIGAAVPEGLAVGVEVEPPLRRGSAPLLRLKG